MTRLKVGLLCAAVAALSVAPASAQIAGRPIEVSGGIGWSHPDTRARRQDGPAFGGSVAWRVSPGLAFEGSVLFAPSKSDTTQQKFNFTSALADFRWNLRTGESRVVPFLLTGGGYGLSHTTGHDPDKLERGAGSIGMGALINVMNNQRTYLRLQVKDVLFRERDAREFSSHIAATIGIHYVYGGKPHDQDLDGVRDWLDKCPDTPIGAKVDANGCPIDSDGDGVFDGIDQCANTPKGAKVDKKGCPIDSDGDGVFDGLDQCADTPRGATVDATGCPHDSDGDGVLDGLDKCPNTPKGCELDSLTGCPKDADGDGVCDGLDQCPNTPRTLKVDEKGCPIEIVDRETELLDTGMIRMQNIEFQTAKADILPESYPALDEVGRVLDKWPTLQIEIGGHTDSRGGAKYNKGLSERRAEAVRKYLLQHFPNLKPAQYTAVGYGSTRPIAPNTSDAGMARNRRVEFVVKNKAVLMHEIEHRRLLQQNESAPPPDTLETIPTEITLPDSTKH